MMFRTVLILCVLCLVMVDAHGRGRGGRGRAVGRRRVGGRVGRRPRLYDVIGRVLHDLACEITDGDGATQTRECPEGDCTLGPLSYMDDDGQEIKTMKFCDVLYPDGTSKVVSTR